MKEKIYEYLNESIDDVKFSDFSNCINYEKYTKKKKVFPKKIILALGTFILIIFSVLVIGLTNKNTNNGSNDDYLLVKASNRLDVESLKIEGDKDYQAFIEKLEIFSAKLSVAIYLDSDKNENLCVSPISVYMALAMTIANSTGTAKEELLNAVGVTEYEVNEFTKYLYSYLKLEKYKKDNYGNEKLASILDLNNSIWINENVKLKQSGLDHLANNFMADSFYAPFSSNNELANKLMGEYVNEKTRELINPQLKLSTDTIFALVNTLYMKDFWDSEVDEINYSKDKYEFISSSGDVVSDYFLESLYNAGRVFESDSYLQFYVSTDSRYKLKIFIPKDGYDLDDVFTVDNLININKLNDFNIYEEKDNVNIIHKTRTIFPKFEASYDNDLLSIFKENFNVSSIFEPGKHMTGLTDIDNIFVSNIIHKTKLKVDEKGIEGAAVTIVVEGVESVEMYENHDFIIDRAFGYLVTDKYDNIIFTGVVNTI